MNKQLIIAFASALGACVFFACASAPAPAPEPPPVAAAPVPQPVIAAPEPPPETFAQVEQKYYNGLLLDGAKPYAVETADTLTQIAKKEWGASYDPYFFPVFILASKDTISDPDFIMPDMTLTIPDLKANLADPSARANIKAFLLEIAGVYAKSSKPHKDEMVSHLTELAGTL